jgi:hypothetical protein
VHIRRTVSQDHRAASFCALYPTRSAGSSHDSSERDRAVPVGPT